MTHYQRGANFERELVKFFRDNGWIATRTPGSKGSFDVIAVRAGRIVLVQAKLGDTGMSIREIGDLIHDGVIAGAEIYCAIKKPRQDFYFINLKNHKGVSHDHFSQSGAKGGCVR